MGTHGIASHSGQSGNEEIDPTRAINKSMLAVFFPPPNKAVMQVGKTHHCPALNDRLSSSTFKRSFSTVGERSLMCVTEADEIT